MNEKIKPITPTVLKMLVIIIDKNQSKKLITIFNKLHTRISLMFSGIGTANSEILDLFGLSGGEKTISITLTPEFKIPLFMAAINDEFRFSKPGRGIAFTLPLSGVALPVFNMVSSEELAANKERWEKQMEKEIAKIKNEADFSLIISVIGQGLSEDLMEVAKKAGATGGTIIHSRRVGTEDVVKFFGISVQEEKEIVAILTPNCKKKDIMKAINHSFGFKSESRGMVFSLPVETVVGLNSNEKPFDTNQE